MSRIPRFARILLRNIEHEILLAAENPQWWSQAGSNRRPPECKSGALPAELWPHDVVGLGRFELPTSPLSGVRSNQLSYRPIKLVKRDPVLVGCYSEAHCWASR